MRKSNQEIKDQTNPGPDPKQAVICRVAMMDGNLPYIVPFNYGYRDGCIYIHSAPEGKKIDLIRQEQ